MFWKQNQNLFQTFERKSAWCFIRLKNSLISRTINACFSFLKLENDESEHYVPGTTASIHRDSELRDGGLVVVSWTPSSSTSVDLAASQPESKSVFPISAIFSFWSRNCYFSLSSKHLKKLKTSWSGERLENTLASKSTLSLGKKEGKRKTYFVDKAKSRVNRTCTYQIPKSPWWS